LVKIYLSAGALNQTQQDKEKAAASFKALDTFCAWNGHSLCGIELQNFNQTFNAPGGPVASCAEDFGRALCGATCANAVGSFYNQLGCCFTTILQAESEWAKPGDEPFLPKIRDFTRDRCRVAAPAGCIKAGKFIAARIVIRNFVWAYYLANIAAVKAAILADLAVQIGARLNQIRLEGEPTQVMQTSGAGFSLMAAEGMTINVRVDSDGNTGDVDATAEQFSTSVKQNQVAFVQSGRMPYNSRSDPSLGLTIDATASTVTAENGAGRATFSLFAVLAAILAVVALF
jgi:hypothetical protein